jgi:hypothetical protein
LMGYCKSFRSIGWLVCSVAALSVKCHVVPSSQRQTLLKGLEAKGDRILGYHGQCCCSHCGKAWAREALCMLWLLTFLASQQSKKC